MDRQRAINQMHMTPLEKAFGRGLDAIFQDGQGEDWPFRPSFKLDPSDQGGQGAVMPQAPHISRASSVLLRKHRLRSVGKY
jgi:hypothetical protein